jgi:hypothetical protein
MAEQSDNPPKKERAKKPRAPRFIPLSQNAIAQLNKHNLRSLIPKADQPQVFDLHTLQNSSAEVQEVILSIINHTLGGDLSIVSMAGDLYKRNALSAALAHHVEEAVPPMLSIAFTTCLALSENKSLFSDELLKKPRATLEGHISEALGFPVGNTTRRRRFKLEERQKEIFTSLGIKG